MSSVSSRISRAQISENYPRPLRGPPLWIMQYVIYFRFVDDVTFSHNGACKKVLGSQPASDVSHKPGSRLPLLSARPAVTLATLKRAATNFAAW